MTLPDLLNRLERKGVKLWVEQERLKFRAPKGALSTDLKAVLADKRADLITYLKNQTAVTEGIYPLSYNQQSLWFIHQFDSQTAAYNIGAACRIVSQVNTSAVHRALHQLAQRHPILRTTYILSQTENLVRQKINSTFEVPFEHLDASHWQEDEIQTRVEDHYRIPFDLEQGPVFRAQLFTRKPDDHFFLLTFHHIACDAWSLRILLDDFKRYYKAAVDGIAIKEESLTYQYTDYVAAHHAMVASPKGQDLLSFWQKQLQGMPDSLRIKTDGLRPAVQQLKGKSHFFEIKEDVYQNLKKTAKKYRTTLSSLLLSIFNLLLTASSGQKEFAVGMPAAVRDDHNFRDVCGYFVNPVMIRSQCDDGQSFRQFLEQTAQSVFKALEHQAYPFSLLVEKLIPQRDPSLAPGFQVMFNILSRKTLGTAAKFLCPSRTDKVDSFGGLKTKPIPIAQQEGQYDLTLEFLDTDDYLYGVLKYNTDLFKPESMHDFVLNFQQLAQTIMDRTESTIAEILASIELAGQKHKTLSIVLAATFTADLAENALRFWTNKLKINTQIEFAPYNQLFQQLLHPNSLINTNTSGVNILMVRFEDWLQDSTDQKDQKIKASQDHMYGIERNIEDFLNALNTAVKASSATFIVLLCPPSHKIMTDRQCKDFFDRTEKEFCRKLNTFNGVYAVSSQQILSAYPVDEYDEPLGDKIAHIPYSEAFFIALATMAARKIFAVINKPYKVIVVDCDNTLWNGIVGEEGALHISIDAEKIWLQNFLIDQYASGRLICLCSKNNPTDVQEVFKKHLKMILQWDHIAAEKINWSPKSQNIIALAQELNIGLDSFIFIDDNPMECAEVRSACPEVLVVQMPSLHISLKHYFSHIWAFDCLKVTAEDRSRSTFYIKNHERQALQNKTLNYADFINELELDVHIAAAHPAQVNRISQLTHRTNQFNLNKIERSESEIEQICAEKSIHCNTITLSDRFGDYGLAGVMITQKQSDCLWVDSFLLSCRALGRGVEHRMLAYLGAYAQQHNLSKVQLNFLPTDKNQPARLFLDTLGREYIRKEGIGLVYDLPAEVAAKAKFKPESINADLENMPLQGSAIQQQNIQQHSRPSHDVYLEIAADFDTIQKIETHIRPQRLLASMSTVQAEHSSTMDKLVSTWCEILNRDSVNVHDNFFDIGGKSILIPLVVLHLKKRFAIDISIVDVLQFPTIASLAAHIDRNLMTNDGQKLKIQVAQQKTTFNDSNFSSLDGIAIIGMAGRFPGADSIDQFWQNLIQSKDTISTFTDQECQASGVPDFLLKNSAFVRRAGIVRDPDKFDAAFFNYSHI